MKKLIIFTILYLCLSSLMAMNTAKSIFFADSYMLRAHGVEANYWNPAKLSPETGMDIWLPLSNFGIFVANNALDLDTYNYVVTRDTLFAAEKERILGSMDGALRLSSGGNMSVFGVTLGPSAISSSVNFYAKGAISEKFIRLALYGNSEDEYIFYESNNNASSIAYTDFTYGMGNIRIPGIPEAYPQVMAGFSASLLAGLYSVNTQNYEGYFNTDIDTGANFHQRADLRIGFGGVGFKSMLGFYSEITPYLEAGITLDNLFGAINWNLNTEMYSFYATADSVYAANLEEDILDYDDTNEEIDSFTTTLPPEMRMAVMYKHKYAVVSMDWVQGFRESAVTNATGRLSFAASFLPTPMLPLSFGISLPSSRIPLKVSYGIGLKIKRTELGMAVQSYDSIIPGSKSKGISFATNLRLGF